ncbi:hypothetical protein [Streptomyces sp. bgisy032]|uniref:hypothetical protein n=1 Tax=Streptomyces sp. bgisy032 TaxID=3413773 RepID=UPI003D7195F9
MSDLHLEDTIFVHLKKTFFFISDRMEDARRSLKGTDATAVGESQLIEDVQDFADDWGYGIKQLGKQTHGTAHCGAPGPILLGDQDRTSSTELLSRGEPL